MTTLAPQRRAPARGPAVRATASRGSTRSRAPLDSEDVEHFMLSGVNWPFYDLVLRGLRNRNVFVTYDRGTIELMSPSYEHERVSELFGVLLRILADELNVPLTGGGSTTFRRRDLDRGLEPDCCFYIENEPRVRGRRRLNLAKDPPPDLAVEVEVSRRALDRVPIYEAIGVPELWRYDGRRLSVWVLAGRGKNRRYRAADKSLAFPSLPLDQVHDLIQSSWTLGETAWRRAARVWVRNRVAKR
jgi:Uma2 family endonuclease